MWNTFTREAPAILIDVVVSILAFFLGAGWWKVSGREFGMDTAVFWAKIFAGVCLFGIVLDFVI